MHSNVKNDSASLVSIRLMGDGPFFGCSRIQIYKRGASHRLWSICISMSVPSLGSLPFSLIEIWCGDCRLNFWEGNFPDSRIRNPEEHAKKCDAMPTLLRRFIESDRVISDN